MWTNLTDAKAVNVNDDNWSVERSTSSDHAQVAFCLDVVDDLRSYAANKCWIWFIALDNHDFYPDAMPQIQCNIIVEANSLCKYNISFLHSAKGLSKFLNGKHHEK